MELLDKVDIRDNIIGTTTKDEAHENGYCHRVVAVFVFTSNDRLLVQLRKKDGLLDHSVGGHVKQGESYDEAVIREANEELRIVKEFKKVGVFYANEIVPNRKRKVVHYFGLYEVQLADKEINEIIIAEDEVEKLIPMGLEEIVEQMTKTPEKYTTGFIATLNFYISERGLAISVVKLQ